MANARQVEAGGEPQRLVSLDVLRGLTVALMILVNNAGDGAVSYAELRHSVWNGCTLTDVVFPVFLFIVGASIVLAFRSRLARGVSRRAVLRQVMKRALLIAALGLLLNELTSIYPAQLRYYGVLQRIALCYLLASMVYLAGKLAACAAVMAASLVGYWWLLVHVAVPGFGMPGRDVPVLDRAGNLAAWLDRLLVPAAHLYHHGNYDPEGLLSTIPALGTTLLGLLAAAWLQTRIAPAKKAAGLLAAGAGLLALGWWWAHWFPLNKRLWTSSYAVFTAGIAMIALAVLYWLIDGLGVRRGLMPWLVFGTNALTAYVLSEALAIGLAAMPLPRGGNLQQFLYHLLPGWLGPPPLVSMIYSVLFVGLCGLPVFYLYRRRFFLKL